MAPKPEDDKRDTMKIEREIQKRREQASDQRSNTRFQDHEKKSEDKGGGSKKD